MKLSLNKTNKLIKLALFFGIAVVALSWTLYSWYYQSLPQAAIYVLNEMPALSAGERILIFSPHPDDETVAAGGFIAASVKDGAQVWVVLVTNGNKHGLEYSRYDEFIKATGALGVPESNLFFLGYPDGGLSRVNPASLRMNLENIIDQINPTIILAPIPADYNLDHRTLGQAVEQITSGSQEKVYYYLVHYPHFPMPQSYAPNTYLLPPLRLLNSGETWRKFVLSSTTEGMKRNAVLEYKSQLANPFLQSLLLGMIRKNELFVTIDHVR
ncbi:MAG: PIG-L family deacetylase [Patescibacteria group bacterium]|nr:PIG-L family deacetylase [Patescibacteria group bacterium]